VDFYDVGDTWTESTPTFDQKIANLKIMGGDADVDNFLKQRAATYRTLKPRSFEAESQGIEEQIRRSIYLR